MYENTVNRLLNDAKAVTAIPQNLVDGFKNDFNTLTDANKQANFLFNPDASLQDVYKYESSAINVATAIDGAADLAGAAGCLDKKAVQAVTKSFAMI